MATFGNSSVSGSSGDIASSTTIYLRGGQFSLSEDGTPSSISGSISVGAGVTGDVKYAIYSSNGTFQCETSAITGLTSGTAWRTANISGTPPLLSAGTYWLVASGQITTPNGPNTISLNYSSGSITAGIKTLGSFAFPRPLGSYTSNTSNYSIYCTYTTTPAGPDYTITQGMKTGVKIIG